MQRFLNKIHCCDNMELMQFMPDGCVDTIITDPPYGLSFMGKKWDYDVPGIDVWQEALRVLKPGGTLLCFAGSRTQHRMACNVEDAGFILKDCIMWLYGSGFPKATDISKQLQKKSGKNPVVVGQAKHGACNKPNSSTFSDDSYEWKRHFDITEPTTPEAKLWNGWKSHGLKPAYEPILVAMKPNDGTYANNALVHGVSGLNIDGGRIPAEPELAKNWDRVQSSKQGIASTGLNVIDLRDRVPTGRFPANIILDEEAGRMLDEQSGVLKSGNLSGETTTADNKIYNTAGATLNRKLMVRKGDSGGASRFFYCAKASKSERNAGCEDLELKDPCYGKNMSSSDKGSISDSKLPNQNNHPTVKPLALMEYLCTLTKTPTGGIVFDPFCGSGTTAVACIKTNRQFIGCELSEDYCKIARKRILNEILA